MYSKILNMTMINTNPNPEYDMVKNTLLIEVDNSSGYC